METHVDKGSGWKVSIVSKDNNVSEWILEDDEKKIYKKVIERGSKLSIEKWIEFIQIAKKSRDRTTEPTLKYIQRLLLMVHELHKMGFQKLRIYPGMAPSGCCWRCQIVTAKCFYKKRGMSIAENLFDMKYPSYSSGMGNNYYGWDDCQSDDSRELARKFLERFPEVALEGEGRDWEYVGWYTEMLKHSERAIFPVAYDDYHYGENDFLMTTNSKITLPLPPGGEKVCRKRN